jgi:hypothetical protein
MGKNGNQDELAFIAMEFLDWRRETMERSSPIAYLPVAPE